VLWVMVLGVKEPHNCRRLRGGAGEPPVHKRGPIEPHSATPARVHLSLALATNSVGKGLDLGSPNVGIEWLGRRLVVIGTV
jgi:hypothetical protein